MSRLIAGAKGHICGACLDVCNKIIKATPTAFRTSWDAMSDEHLLGSLAPCSAAVEATRQILHIQVNTLRKRGVSWETIGSSLGVSRQAAWERFS